MAYNDMSSFLPSKSAYTNPGEYESTQRNIALSKGTYMAEMDKTYAQLNEMSREFDLTHGLEQGKFDFAKDMDAAKFLETIREFDIEANLKQQGVNIQGSQVAGVNDYYKDQIKSNEQGRLFDWIGAADTIFSDGGIWDSVGGWFD